MSIDLNFKQLILFTVYTLPIVQAPEQFCLYPSMEKNYNLFIVICATSNRFGPLDGDPLVVSCGLNKCYISGT
jgi:hypothetical protein